MTPAESPVSARRRLLPVLSLVLLILGACLACGQHLASSTPNTWDEPEHLAAGIELLDRGRYEYDTEHPPIVRALAGVGARHLAGARSFGTPPPDGVQEGIDILLHGRSLRSLSDSRKAGNATVSGAAAFVRMALGATKHGFESEALLAVLLLASVPPILGHAALARLSM